MKKLPKKEILTELFEYNPSNGLVTRKCNCGPRARQGDIVGTYNGWSYLRIVINGQAYQLHRIVWLMHTGDDPYPYEIDHINRIRDDNRIDNLRLVTRQENLKNKSLHKANKSGYPGVYKRGNRYQARYTSNGVEHHVGMYDSALEAHRAIIEHKK